MNWHLRISNAIVRSCL